MNKRKRKRKLFFQMRADIPCASLRCISYVTRISANVRLPLLRRHFLCAVISSRSAHPEQPGVAEVVARRLPADRMAHGYLRHLYDIGLKSPASCFPRVYLHAAGRRPRLRIRLLLLSPVRQHSELHGELLIPGRVDRESDTYNLDS